MCELFPGVKVEQLFLHIQVKIPYNYKLRTDFGCLDSLFSDHAHITAYL